MSKLYYWMIFVLTTIPFFANAQFSRVAGRLTNPYHQEYQRFSAGYNHQVELRNGKIYATGRNNYGQLGNGTTVDSRTPVQCSSADNWVQVSAGENFNVAIKADGTLWAWGYNNRGQLGIGNTENQKLPVQVGNDNDWISASAGSRHVIALKNDGSLWAWGYNYYGQLGNGSVSGYSQASPDPQRIGIDNNWTAISAGYNHNLALKADGTLWAWGENSVGQVGNGETSLNGVTIPTKISSEKRFRNISAGGFFSSAIATDGHLLTWGDNYYGELGNGSNIASNIPLQITDNHWRSIEAGKTHLLALHSDGSVWSWGDEMGNNSTQNNLPLKKNIKNIAQISAGDGFSMALSAQGKTFVWGKNNFGQLGNAGLTGDKQETPIENNRKNNEIVSVVSGHGFSTMALYSNGTLKGWGYNGDYNLGNGTKTNSNVPIEIPRAGDNNLSVSTGYGTALVLKADGSIWGWGDNDSGAVGTGGAEEHEVAAAPISQTNDWISVSAGSFASAGIKADGTLWIWGSNYYGEAGDGTREDVMTPKMVGTNEDRWSTVSIGAFHTLAIKEDGTLWGWGRNASGEAGGGDNPGNILKPQEIGGGHDWVAVNAHTNSSIALKADSTLWGFGSNGMGQLGQPLPITGKILRPTRIGETRYTQAKLGSWSGAAIDKGTLQAWSNFALYFHELGINDNSNHPTPTIVPGHSDIIQISSGQNHKSILKAQRTDACLVGRNAYGEVGAGTTTAFEPNYVCGIAKTMDKSLTVNVRTADNSPATINEINQTLQLTAEIIPAEAPQNVYWSVIDGSEFVKVNQYGLITGLKYGKAIIRATALEDQIKYGEIEVTVSKILGTSSVTQKKLLLYPNPTTGEVFISPNVNPAEIEIYDSTGRKIMRMKAQNINLQEMPSGTYMIRIICKDGTSFTSKIIKV